MEILHQVQCAAVGPTAVTDAEASQQEETYKPGDRKRSRVEAWVSKEAGLRAKVDGKEDRAGENEGAQEQQCLDDNQHHPAPQKKGLKQC